MNYYISQNKSPINDFLYGIQKTTSTCLKCNTIKYNFQSFNLLYFPLKEAKRIAVLRKKKENEKFDEKKYILNLEDCLLIVSKWNILQEKINFIAIYAME